MVQFSLDVADTSFTINLFNDFEDVGQGAFNEGFLSVDLTNLNSPMGAITNVVLDNSNFGNGVGTPQFTANSIFLPFDALIPPGERTGRPRSISSLRERVRDPDLCRNRVRWR